MLSAHILKVKLIRSPLVKLGNLPVALGHIPSIRVSEHLKGKRGQNIITDTLTHLKFHVQDRMENMNNLQAHTICIQDMNTFNYNLYDFIKKCTKTWNWAPSSSTPKKYLSPPVQLGQSISEMSQVWCIKHAAWTYIYIYVCLMIWLMRSMYILYYHIDMIDDACVLLHLMKNDVRTVCIGLYNIAKLFLNPLKFYSVPYHITTIVYTRICCMTRWLKNFEKKHGE